MGSSGQESEAEESVNEAAAGILAKARQLELESRHLRRYHQVFTVTTILLGVSAPALVTADKGGWWQLAAIVVTAFASASATIRTVLRFSERYSNSALTSLALLDVEAQVRAKKEEVMLTVKPEYLEQKLFEVAAWARKQTFEVTKGYVEKDVSALTVERTELAAAPSVDEHQRADATKKGH
jgi:hypothetical protein